jgi:hypothetical protein
MAAHASGSNGDTTEPVDEGPFAFDPEVELDDFGQEMRVRFALLHDLIAKSVPKGHALGEAVFALIEAYEWVLEAHERANDEEYL